MKQKLGMLVSLLLILTVLMVCSCALADDVVYGKATLTYAEFYAGDVSSVADMDAVSSATTGKSGSFSNVSTDFVDEVTNADGYHILGVANVNVAVASADVEAYLAINPTFVRNASEEVPAQYKTVTIEDGKALYSATNFHVAATVEDAALEVVTDSHWGDYQVNVIESTTQYIRNTRTDEGFAVNSNVMGAIVETASGLKVGMEALQSLWVQPYEISWNVSVDNSHNDELVYDNLPELDKLMGEKIVKITYINADDAYAFTFDGAYLPIKFPSSLTAANATSAGLSTTYEVVGLVDDYQANYSVEALGAVCEDGVITWTEDLPGAYTLLLIDDSGVYAKLTADFILNTNLVPVAYDVDENSIVTAEGASEAMAECFLKNLSKAVVNGKEYNVSGHGAVAIVDEDGEVDLDAVQVSGRGKDAVETPVFEDGDNEVSLVAVGFDLPLIFTVTK